MSDVDAVQARQTEHLVFFFSGHVGDHGIALSDGFLRQCPVVGRFANERRKAKSMRSSAKLTSFAWCRVRMNSPSTYRLVRGTGGAYRRRS
jgi:hypothetical protein